MNNQIFIDHYIMYGLNRNRSFIQYMPMYEEQDYLYMPSKEDIESFSAKILKAHDCENCALFYVFKDGTYGAYMKTVCDMTLLDEEKVLQKFAICTLDPSDDHHFFAQLDGMYRFCCYSLLIETDNGVFEVCT